MLDELHVNGSMTGMVIQQSASVTNSVFENIRQRYLSGLPVFELGNLDLSFQPDLYWARHLDTIERRYDELNSIYGTDIQPNYYAPQAIVDLMQTR